MKINLNDLATNQLQLDNYIFQRNNTTNKETFEDRIMALLVEIGETANEIRFFKFWSQKESSAKKIILEEFIDILHFVISLGVSVNFTDWNLEFENETSLKKAFFNLYDHTILFQKNNSKNEFKQILFALFTVADRLCFSADDIFEMYQLKNKINFDRQDSNY